MSVKIYFDVIANVGKKVLTFYNNQLKTTCFIMHNDGQQTNDFPSIWMLEKNIFKIISHFWAYFEYQNILLQMICHEN